MEDRRGTAASSLATKMAVNGSGCRDLWTRAMELLRGRPLKIFSIAAVSADASIDFGDGHLLQVLNGSSGYEGWTLSDTGGRQVIAQGGGSVVVTLPKAAR